jgi:hypothetical protein
MSEGKKRERDCGRPDESKRLGGVRRTVVLPLPILEVPLWYLLSVSHGCTDVLSSSFLFFYQGLVCQSWTSWPSSAQKGTRNGCKFHTFQKRKKKINYDFPLSGVHGAALEGGLEQLQEGSARFVDGRGQLLKVIVYGVHLDVQVLKSNHVSANESLGCVHLRLYVPV